MKQVYLLLFLAILQCSSVLAQSKLLQQTDTLKSGIGYNLFSKTPNISSVLVSTKKNAKKNIMYIYVGYPAPIPTSNAILSNVIGGKNGETRDNIPLFDKIDIITGNYEDIIVSPDTKYRNLFKLTGLTFPIRLKLRSGLEVVDFEILKPGEWSIDIELKNI